MSPYSTYPADEDLVRPTVIEIDLGAIGANFAALQKLAGPAKVMAIVKANAYGHGMVPVVRHLETCGAKYFGVAYIEEAVELRRHDVTAAILVLGGLLDTQIKYFIDFDVDITASSVAKLDAIEAAAAKAGKRARVHLKIDTGMERIGTHWYSAGKLLERAITTKHCEIVGIFSHLASAKEGDDNFTKLQLERFLETCEFFPKHSAPMPIRHLAVSGALTMPETYLDMIRPGIALYGGYPTEESKKVLKLKPAMSLKTRVVYFKVVKKGAGVSYGLTWQAAQDTRVITIPVGYGDGFPRRMLNCGSALVHGKRYPIVGRVCMDQMMIDIGPDGEAYNGDEVVLLGRQGSEEITVEQIAALVDGNPHEILSSFNQRIPRIYTGG